MIVSSAAFGAVLQSSLFGLAGILPAAYTTPIMSGQGFAGTFAAFSMICALACTTPRKRPPNEGRGRVAVGGGS